MSFRHALLATTLSLGLGLTGCAGMNGFADNAQAGGSSAQASAVQNLPLFLNKIEAARGSALPITDRLAIGGITAESKSLLDNTQNHFLDVLGERTGMGADALKLLAPSVATPVSSSELVGKVEAKLGRRLTSADSTAIKAAATLRNNSLSSLKDSLADKIGTRTGVGKDTVVALLPLIGM